MKKEIIIYEDENIKIVNTEKDYDFIAYIENKTDKDITIQFEDELEYEQLEDITVGKNNWIGLLADDEGYDYLEAFKKSQFYYE